MFLCGKHLKKGVGFNIKRQNHYLDSCKQGLLFNDFAKLLGLIGTKMRENLWILCICI